MQVGVPEVVTMRSPVLGYSRTDYYDWKRLGASRAAAHSLLGGLGAKLVRCMVGCVHILYTKRE